MPDDGSGVHSLPAGYLAVAGQTIQPSQHNPPLEDLSSALTNRISRTGVTTITADIPWGGFKITGLGDATAATDALNQQSGDARYPQSSGLRNLVINGMFGVNQRAFAGGALAAGAFGYDRWKASSGGANYSVTAGVCTISSGSIEQVIEGLNIELTDTYSINWAGTATCTVDGVAKTKAATFTLTRGTNSTIKFTGAGATLSEVQVVRGAFQGLFESRPSPIELMLCQRYYQRRTTQSVTAYGAASPATQTSSWPFPVEMRAIPTSATVSTPTLSNCTTFTVNALAQFFLVTVTITGPAGNYAVGADGVVEFTAEL